MEKSEIEKKYIGYGYHGGGRKPLPEEQKKKYITISISGQPAEIERLKARAQEEHKTVSRFILDDSRFILDDSRFILDDIK